VLPNAPIFFSNRLFKFLKADCDRAPLAKLYSCRQIRETYSIPAIASSGNCSHEDCYGRISHAGYVKYAARCCWDIDPTQGAVSTLEKGHAFATTCYGSKNLRLEAISLRVRRTPSTIAYWAQAAVGSVFLPNQHQIAIDIAFRMKVAIFTCSREGPFAAIVERRREHWIQPT